MHKVPLGVLGLTLSARDALPALVGTSLLLVSLSFTLLRETLEVKAQKAMKIFVKEKKKEIKKKSRN